MTDRVLGPTQTGPLAPDLARLLGGTFDGDTIHVDGHTITSTLRGAVVLDAHTPAAVELGRHHDGSTLLAAKYRASVAVTA